MEAHPLNSSEKEAMLPVSDPSTPPRSNDRRSPMTSRGVYAALSYMSCAVLLVLFNKAALSSYNFPCANVITLFQMISSSSFLYALRRRKLISFSAGESLTGTEASTKLVPVKTLIHTLPLALSYLLYMIVSMESIRGVNVPMYTTLRRTTVVFTMLVEYFLAGQKYPSSILVSVSMIVFGAFIAGARDLSFDSYGYGVVFLSNISTAIYLATISRLGKSSGLNSFGLMWCNGIMCAPLLFFWTLIRGDLEKTVHFQYLLSPGFMHACFNSISRLRFAMLAVSFIFAFETLVMLLSCILAFFLNYSIFLNTTLNSAVTQTICGNLKDFFTIALGWTFFGGLPFDFLNVIGQLFGFLGSGLYAYFKLVGK